jgi:hypothetical protein
MAEFDVFRIPRDHPFPTTMRTALRALRLGAEGPEPFYFRATSVDSIHKRPIDPGSVKELLARSRLDARTNHGLSRALFNGLVDEDRDLADFAAQGLTRIENRYQEAIKEAERAFNESGAVDELCRVAELLLDFADIQWFDETLRRFYIQRAAELLEANAPEEEPSGSQRLATLRVRAEVMRDNLEKAEEILAPLAVEESSELLLLKAELSYRKRDILAVAEALARLKTRAINDTTRELVDSWIGKGSPE